MKEMIDSVLLDIETKINDFLTVRDIRDEYDNVVGGVNNKLNKEGWTCPHCSANIPYEVPKMETRYLTESPTELVCPTCYNGRKDGWDLIFCLRKKLRSILDEVYKSKGF